MRKRKLPSLQSSAPSLGRRNKKTRIEKRGAGTHKALFELITALNTRSLHIPKARHTANKGEVPKATTADTGTGTKSYKTHTREKDRQTTRRQPLVVKPSPTKRLLHKQ